LIETIDRVGLSPLGATKQREIVPIENWPSIVSTSHIDDSGKHLSLHATTSSIRSKWSTDQEAFFNLILRIALSLAQVVKKHNFGMKFTKFLVNFLMTH